MELIDGAPLGEHFNSLKEKNERFSEERLWNIFTQVGLHSKSFHIMLFLQNALRRWWGRVVLRRRVSNHARSTRVGSNPILGITNHPRSVNEYSEVTLRAQALNTH